MYTFNAQPGTTGNKLCLQKRRGIYPDPIRSGGVNRVADAEDRGDWLTQDEITNNPISYPASYKCKADETSSWHGMEVSGIIGAESNNALGMASVGGQTKVLPVRVLGKCGGLDSDIIQGMRWAAGLAVDGRGHGRPPSPGRR